MKIIVGLEIFLAKQKNCANIFLEPKNLSCENSFQTKTIYGQKQFQGKVNFRAIFFVIKIYLINGGKLENFFLKTFFLRKKISDEKMFGEISLGQNKFLADNFLLFFLLIKNLVGCRYQVACLTHNGQTTGSRLEIAKKS